MGDSLRLVWSTLQPADQERVGVPSKVEATVVPGENGAKYAANSLYWLPLILRLLYGNFSFSTRLSKTAKMSRYTILSSVAAVTAILMIFVSQSSADRDSTIVVLCAPSLAGPMEELKQTFNQSDDNLHKIRIENTYRGSAELLAMYEISQIGDVLIAADVNYHNEFIAAEFCDATQTLAKQFPCLIFNSVSNEDALSILGGEDSVITTSVPKPKHAAIGRMAASILGGKQYELLLDRAKVSRETVSQVAADVSNGIVDVGIAWNTSCKQFSNLKCVIPSGWSDHSSQIGASVLLSSPRLEDAEAFVDFLRTSQAQAVFQKHGFTSSERRNEVVQGGAE